MLKTLLALILLAAVAAADRLPSMTGKFWKIATLNTRTAYLVGFREGIVSADTPDQKFSKRYLSDDRTLAMTIAEIDRFYEAPENLKLPVALALIVITEKAKGMSQAEVDAWLARMRPDFTEDGELIKK